MNTKRGKQLTIHALIFSVPAGSRKGNLIRSNKNNSGGAIEKQTTKKDQMCTIPEKNHLFANICRFFCASTRSSIWATRLCLFCCCFVVFRGGGGVFIFIVLRWIMCGWQDVKIQFLSIIIIIAFIECSSTSGGKNIRHCSIRFTRRERVCVCEEGKGVGGYQGALYHLCRSSTEIDVTIVQWY